MFRALVMAGHGIKEGERIGHVHNYDIAPTVAELLDLHMGYMKGRVLEEALTPKR